MVKLLITDIAVRGKGRNNIQMIRIKVLILIRQFDLCMSFGDLVYTCKGTAHILVIPVFHAMRFTHVKNQKMHFINIVIHRIV